MTDSGQSTTSFSPTATSYTLTVSNPCPSTTVSSITFNPTSITVTNGSTATSEFVIPTDGVDTAASPLTGLCGNKSYSIGDGTNTGITTWAAITDSSTDGSKTLTIDPSQYTSYVTSSVTVTLTITTTLDDWSGNSGSTSTISVTMNPASCSCSAMAWTAPSITTATVNVDASATPSVPAPASDDSAKTTNIAFGTCFESGGGGCTTTGSYGSGSIVQTDGSALPSWITWNHSSQVLTVAPDNPSYVGTWYLKGTYSPATGSASAFSVVTITVQCVVTSMTRPSNPTSNLAYNVWDASIAHDFSQTWVQSPACGHTMTDSFTWTGANSYLV